MIILRLDFAHHRHYLRFVNVVNVNGRIPGQHLDAGVTPAPSASLRHLSCEGEAVYDGFFDFAIKALDLLDDLDSDSPTF